MPTPEALEAISALRQKIASGNYTQDDVREGVRLMREGRIAAAQTSAKAKTTRAKAKDNTPINTDDLLKGLEDM